MIVPLIDRKIREAFSNSAIQYEVLANLQKEIGRELTKKITVRDNYARILDVGMGTGWLTNRLNQFFPDSTVIGLDPAAGMLNQARKKYENLKVVRADARAMPLKSGHFELVTSNLAYQWVSDLERAFQNCYRVLKDEGIFCFTMFGHGTLKELFYSLEESLKQKATEADFPLKRLATGNEVADALKRSGFHDVEITSEVIKTHFPDMFSLLKWLKGIGANTNRAEVYIGKELLQQTNEIYNKKYKDRLGIFATFEVLWIETKKKK